MMTPDDLKIQYKFDTGLSASEIEVHARIGSRGDVIIDGGWLPDAFIDKARNNLILLPDLNYVEWLERKFCETLNRKEQEKK